VEEIAAERGHSGDAGGRAVQRIAGYGMADAGEVHANLVGAAGADLDFKKREAREAAQDTILAPGGTAAAGEARGHAGAVDGIAGDGTFDAALLRGHRSVDQCEIDFLDFAAGKLGCQAVMGRIVLGDEEDSAGEAIEAMDDAGAQFAGHAGKRMEAMEQGIDQGSGMNAGAGVDDHAGGFIDGDEVVIFIEHGKRNRLRSGVQGRRREGPALDGFAGAGFVRGAGDGAIDEDAAKADPLLNARAAELGKALVQELIEPLAGVGGFAGKAHEGNGDTPVFY